MSSYSPILQSGLNFYTASSAFQKCIRRGMQDEALWLGTEFYLSGYEEYAWFRLRVIVSEDVGLANPELPSQIQALYQTYIDFKKKKNKHGPERLPFIHALLLVIRSPKSRLVDNYLCEYFFLRETVEQPDLNDKKYDFIWDMHTLKGKQKGRGNEHFYNEGGKVENVPDWLQEEEELMKQIMLRKEVQKEIDDAQRQDRRLSARTGGGLFE